MQNNLFFETLPLIAFFAIYYFSKNIFLATAVLIVISWGQLIICKIKYKTISKKLWAATALITLFGGLTILLHNKLFIMLKPTALYWVIGVGMFVGQKLGKNGFKMMLEKEVHLPDRIWNQLNTAGAIFFILLGGLNLFVAFNFSESVWVKFKVFGCIGITIAFVIGCAIYVSIYHKKSIQRR